MCIHGDKSQPERDWVLKGMLAFNGCTSTVLFGSVQLYTCINKHSSYYSFVFFSEFREGKAPVLIATDVASRGLGW